MISNARREYGGQIRERKTGVASTLGSDATLIEAKPHFYADARLLIDRVREVYAGYRSIAPPYGLFDAKGEPFRGFGDRERRWVNLERLISATARKAFEAVAPPETGCPYHNALQNLGHIPLQPSTAQEPDVERLREVVFPGAQFAPATIVNILKRMPAMATAHRASLDTETLARNSNRTLLQEPLHHPQQHAKAFTFCLADGMGGTDWIIDRDNFMPDDVIDGYTKLGTNAAGHEAIVWSIPTVDFVLRASVHVANRIEGPEAEMNGDHITLYPAGTRLGAIALNEPTIGCPGSQLAYDMWDQATDVIANEDLWQPAT